MRVTAINSSEEIAICDDDVVVPFVKMFSADGNETEDVDDAFTVIVQLPDGMWEVIELDDFDPVRTH